MKLLTLIAFYLIAAVAYVAGAAEFVWAWAIARPPEDIERDAELVAGMLYAMPNGWRVQKLNQNKKENQMHDAKGRELTVGDRVLIPAEVRALTGGPDLCNVTVGTLGGRSPDGARESIIINTKQLIRANEGDDTAFEVFEDNGKRFLR